MRHTLPCSLILRKRNPHTCLPGYSRLRHHHLLVRTVTVPDIANAKAQHIIANRHNRWISVMKVSLRLELGRESTALYHRLENSLTF